MVDDEPTREELHLMYYLCILELTPEETAARVWPKAGEIAAPFNLAYVAQAFAQDQAMRASGALPPFPKEEFLEWTGFPAEDIARKN